MGHTLVSAAELESLLPIGDVLIVDCRFDLGDPAKGAREHMAAHIPGAVHADLDRDLSNLAERGVGRHPLPSDATLSSALSRWGFRDDRDVIAYDDASGALAAARLWWLLRLVGHDRVRVLDGGLGAWRAHAAPLESGNVMRDPSDVHVVLDRDEVVWSDELLRRRADPATLLMDARATPRFRGEVEPIDAKAGHVPHAVNRPFSTNLDATGRFKPVAELHREFDALLGSRTPRDVVHMCGSGVTACHNLLAMEHAGLAGSRIYAPSWSGWISDATRPIAVGDG